MSPTERRIAADEPAGALALAEQVLERAMAAGASEAEVLVTAEDAALTRFANSEIHQNVAESNLLVNVRFISGRRVAVASTGRADAAGLADVVARAASIAANVEELEDWGGLPGPGPDGAPELPAAWSDATAGATPELRAAGAQAVIASADAAGVLAYGAFATAAEALAVANSAGIRTAGRRTRSRVVTVQMSPNGGTGYAEAMATDVHGLDAAAIGREAAAKARATEGARSVEPGVYPVVLEEYAVVDILDMLAYLGFSALAVQEGRSCVEPGRTIGSELVTIVDDARDPAGLPFGFDYEGVAKQRLTLVERGVARELAYDAQTAARAGCRSTGHAFPAPNPYGPFPANMLMAPGTASREELIAGLDRGILVTRFHYTNPVHPKLAIVTGMTRDGTFLVEDGKIVAPIRNLRYTQSYLDALAGVEAVGRERKILEGFIGASVVPAVRIAAWEFTGATEH